MCRLGADAPNVGPPSGTAFMRRESGMASPEPLRHCSEW